MNKGKLLLTKSSYELVKPFFIIVKVVVVMETDGNEEYYVCFCKTKQALLLDGLKCTQNQGWGI